MKQKHELYAFLTFLVVLSLDQVSKLWSKRIYNGEQRIGPVELVSVSNKGIAFGQMQGAAGALLIVIIFAILAGLIYYFIVNAERPLLWFSVGMITGGAIGNMIDRIYKGAVHDFISVPSWPAFNLADAFICIGVAILVILTLKKKNSAQAGYDKK